MNFEPRLYVGTYHKYASGSIEGDWLDLFDYRSKDDFLQACRDLHADEEEPELMFQDCDEIPDALYSECCLKEELWEWIELARENPHVEYAQYEAYFKSRDLNDGDICCCIDNCMGYYDNAEDFAQELLEQSSWYNDMPAEYQHLVSAKEYWETWLQYDYDYENGYIFS